MEMDGLAQVVSGVLSPVSSTTAINLPPVINLSPVSFTFRRICVWFITGVVDTDDQFKTGAADIGNICMEGVVDTSAKLKTGVVATDHKHLDTNITENTLKNAIWV